MPNWKKLIVSGSDASLNSLNVTTFISASSFTGSFTGSLFGTSSYATQALTSSYVLNAVSASFASTASSVNRLNQAVVISGSLTVSGSTNIVGNSGTTLLSSNADTLIFTGSLLTSGSIVSTGSLNILGGITGSLLGTASYAIQALTASNANTASFVQNAQTASYVLNAVSASRAVSSSRADSASTASSVNTLTQDVIITGSLTATGNITSNGNLISANSSGDEGGEILLYKSQTNNSLTGSGVTIDSFQNRLRIFEQGGDARGVHIDLTKAPTGVNGELLWKASNIVNAGTFVTLDNIKATVTTTSNRGLSLATVAGTVSGYISGQYQLISGSPDGGASTTNLSTTATASMFSWNFTIQGDASTYMLRDDTNNRVYRIILIIGGAYNNNFISIERLY